MKKFTSFMLMLLCAVTTWGQDVFTNDNLKEITPGIYYIYYTDAEDVKHYLQTTGANTISIVTENPAYYNISVGGGSAFNKAYYIQMNGLCFSNPNPNNNHTLSTGTIGWNAIPYISTVVFENGEGLCALRSTNAPVSTWDENYFITHDESNNVTAIEGSVGGADLFVWTIEKVPVDYTALNNAIEAANNTLANAGYSFTVGNAVALQVDDANAPGYLLAGRPACDTDVLKNAIDNDPNTIYHSAWNVNSGDNHYLQIDLGAEAALNVFELNYTTRMTGNNGAPYEMTVAGSNDGENFATISSLSKDDKYSPLPDSNTKSYSRIFVAKEAYRYLRFTVTKSPNSNNSFGMSTFGIKEVTMTTPENGTKGMRFATLLKEINNAIALVDNASSTTEADNAANALNELTAIVSIECPFTLTTDINNPVYYLIKSARSMSGNGQWGVPTFWKYNSTGDKVNKFTVEKYPNDDAAKDINTYWFFMEDLNTGIIEMYPYNNPVAMGYTTVGDGAEKLTNNHSAENFKGTYFKLVIKTDGTFSEYPYALQPVGYNTYVSNHSGYGKQMGFYSTLDDGGTRFTVIEAITPSKKLATLNEAIIAAEAIQAGTTVGDYTEEAIATLAETINAAKAVYGDATSSDDVYQAQIDALKNKLKELPIVLPAADKFYQLVSACTKDHRGGQHVYVNADGNMHFAQPDVITNPQYAGCTIGDVFQFVPANDGKFYIFNVQRGTYMNTVGKAIATTSATAKAVRITPMGLENRVAIRPDGQSMMHTQDSNSKIVGWDEESATDGSSWKIVELEADITTLSQPVTVSEVGYSTLILGYNAVIPEGVTCYAVPYVSTKAALEAIEGNVLPANTAVIIEAAANTYNFNYSNETATVENMLEGTTTNAYINREAYVLGNVDGNVGLYKAELDCDETGAEGTTHFLNNANKAYLVIPTGSEAIQYFSFDFGGGTTGIEGVEAEGAANGKIYDITGREVKAITAPGIYIVNGAKVVVK